MEFPVLQNISLKNSKGLQGTRAMLFNYVLSKSGNQLKY